MCTVHLQFAFMYRSHFCSWYGVAAVRDTKMGEEEKKSEISLYIHIRTNVMYVCIYTHTSVCAPLSFLFMMCCCCNLWHKKGGRGKKIADISIYTYTHTCMYTCIYKHTSVCALWRHDLFIRMTWLIVMRWWVIGLVVYVTRCIHMCDMTHSFVWHDSSLCATSRVHMWGRTELLDVLSMWHDAFICVTWRIHTYDMTQWVRIRFDCTLVDIYVYICIWIYVYVYIIYICI